MRRRAVLLSAAGVLLAAGCGSSPAEPSAFVEPAAVPTTTSTSGSPSSGSPVPDKTVTTVPATLKFSGKTLLDVCKTATNIDARVWDEFYTLLAQNTTSHVQRGSLPFRIWQIYDEMVEFWASSV